MASDLAALRREHEEQWSWLSHSDACGVTGGYITALEAEVERLMASRRTICEGLEREEERNADLEARVAKLEAEVERLRKGVIAVRDLIGRSEGVAGLHQNGDIAPWRDLLAGGWLEEWLGDLSVALNEEALSRAKTWQASQPSRADTKRLREILEELVDLVDAARRGEYELDSFTTQPARNILASTS